MCNVLSTDHWKNGLVLIVHICSCEVNRAKLEEDFIVLYEIISRHHYLSTVSTMVKICCLAAGHPGYTLVEPPLPQS